VAIATQITRRAVVPIACQIRGYYDEHRGCVQDPNPRILLQRITARCRIHMLVMRNAADFADTDIDVVDPWA
jgi:hypothetical protein